MQIEELRQKIKSGDDGIYLFCGEENYLKKFYLGKLRETIVPDTGFAVFNHVKHEGAEIDVGALADSIRMMPMMSDRKLIEWHGADLNAMKDRDADMLGDVLEDAKNYPGNVIVFVVEPDKFDPGTEKKPSKLYKKLSKFLSIVNFPLSKDAQLCTWITKHFASEGIRLAPGADTAMLEKAGHSMDVLANEIDKVCCYAKAHDIAEVPPKLMEKLVSGTVESDAFSLTEALLDGRFEDAYRYLSDLIRRKVEPVSVLGQVAKLYCDVLTVGELAAEGMTQKGISDKLKMHEYRVGLYMKAARRTGLPLLRRTVQVCGEIDEKMKTGSSGYVGLERLVAGLAATGK